MASRIQQNGKCTPSAYSTNTDSPAICVARKRCRPSFKQQRMAIMKPFTIQHALLLLSLFSVAICFPSERVLLSKSSSAKENVGSRSTSTSSFRHTSYASSHQYSFLPEVFVLSLSSGSRPPKTNLANLDLHGATTTKNKRETNNRKIKSNQITVKTVDEVVKFKQGKELPLRTIEYRRRKHEWAERYTSQEGLREAFGSNRNKWWGDLDAKTARRLYKRLLFPTAISELVLELGDEIVRPEELAPLAYEARKAAKMYVRERCRVPSRVGAYLFDGFRQLRKYGRFQPNGASYEQLWIKYYEENGSHNITDHEWEYLFRENGDRHDRDDDDDLDDDDDDDLDDVEDIMDGIDDAVIEEEIVKRTCQKILEKSCTTNEAIDRFFLKDATAKEDNGMIHSDFYNDDDAENQGEILNEKITRRQRWRNRKKRKDRYNDLLLERITKTLERDVRKLLEPSAIQSAEGEIIVRCDDDDDDDDPQRCRDDTRNSDESGSRKEGYLSSRRMTRQEYHSLKLFAKARKHSQQHQAKENNNSNNNTNDSTRPPRNSNNSNNSVLSTVTVTDRKTVLVDKGE